MDAKINYTIIGVFVFSLGLALIMFLLWMGKYGFEDTQYDHYLIKMPDGVAGLNIESPVKYRGVEVGAVDQIQIDPQNSEYVDVSISVIINTPIKQDNIAVLAAQGITGLSYIEIKGGSNQSPKLNVGGTIQAGKSLFDKLENSATQISEKIVQTLAHVDQLLSEKNVQNIKQLIHNLEQSSLILNEQIPLFLNQKNSQHLEQSLSNTQEFTQVLANNRKTIQTLLKQGVSLEQQASNTLDDISSTSHSLNTTIATIEKKFVSGEYDIRQMTEPHLEEFSDLLKELQLLSGQSAEVLQQLKDSPSDLIFKQQQYQHGPGE